MKTLILLALCASACGPAGTTGREPDEYTGCASDEHWRTFDDQEPTATVDDTQAPPLTAPAAGATLPAASAPMLTWRQSMSDSGQPDGDVPHVIGPGCDNCCPQYNTGAITTLHLPASSGNLYDLQFTIDGQIAHRVLTSLQAWKPKDETWAGWRGKTVTLEIWRMSVLRNDPKAGPFVATTPFTFTVGN